MHNILLTWSSVAAAQYLIIIIISISCKASEYHYHPFQLNSILLSLSSVSAAKYIIIIIISISCTVSYQAQEDLSSTSLAKQIAYNVSKLLDSLLKDYDNSLRPDFGGENYYHWSLIFITNLYSLVYFSRIFYSLKWLLLFVFTWVYHSLLMRLTIIIQLVTIDW